MQLLLCLSSPSRQVLQCLFCVSQRVHRWQMPIKTLEFKQLLILSSHPLRTGTNDPSRRKKWVSPSCERWVTQKVFSVQFGQGVISFTRHQKNRVKVEGLIVSTTPGPKVKQKSSREPDSHKKGGRSGLQKVLLLPHTPVKKYQFYTTPGTFFTFSFSIFSTFFVFYFVHFL